MAKSWRPECWHLSVALLVTCLPSALMSCVPLKDGEISPSDRDGALADVDPLNGGPDEAASGGSATDATVADAEVDAPVNDASVSADVATDASVDDAPSDSRVGPDTSTGDARSHLRLWLTADLGVTCVSGRVTRWADQSGNGNDATIAQSQLGPQCQVTPTPHVVQGVDLPYFSAPESDAAPNVIDETLDVDLSFLAGSNYTIFMVERRWADWPLGHQGNQELILGTTLTRQQEITVGRTCGNSPHDDLLFMGYVYYNPTTAFALDQDCDTLLANAVAVTDPPPLSLGEHTVQFDAALGHKIWLNGAMVSSNTRVIPITNANAGAIGRGLVQTTTLGIDPRFRGDIAEVLVYDAAISDADRTSVETHLARWWQ